MSKIVNFKNTMDNSIKINSIDLLIKKSNENSRDGIENHNKEYSFLNKKRKLSDQTEETEDNIKNKKSDNYKQESHPRKSPEVNKKITDFFKQQKINFFYSKDSINFGSPHRMAEFKSFSDYKEKFKFSPKNLTHQTADSEFNNLYSSLKSANDLTLSLNEYEINSPEQILKFNNNFNEFDFRSNDTIHINEPTKKNKKKHAKRNKLNNNIKSYFKDFRLSSKTVSILSNLKKKKIETKFNSPKNFKLEKLPLSSKNYINIKEIEEKYLKSITLKDKFEGLIKRELILPSPYKCLLLKSEYIDSAIFKLRMRKCQSTLNNIEKLSKEEDFKLIISLDDIQQILYLLPFFYTYKSDRTELYIDIPSDIIQRIKVKIKMKILIRIWIKET